MSDTSSVFLREQEILVRDSARRITAEVIAPTAAERDRTSAWPSKELKSLADVGLMGMHVPEEFGGSGASFVEYCLALEAIAGADAGVATIVHVHNSVAGTLNRIGNDEQKRRWLPAMVSGENIGAYLLSEPHAGSDTAAMRTSARFDGDHYLLNGTKQWISNGSEAGVGIVMAKNDKSAGTKGYSLFVVDPRDPAYKVLRVESKLGQHTAHTAQIQLDDLRVPLADRLGEEGSGYRTTMSLLSEGRVAIAAIAVGVAGAALDAAVRYAKEREAYGRPIFELQAVNFDLADMATRVEIARQ